MREPHKKGVAHHFGSESCVWVREDAGEALTGESAEERRTTKGNAPQAHSRRTQSRGCESQGLWRVRQAARRDRRRRFTALLHHVTPELLRASYWELNHKAVPGIDGETWR